MTTSFEPVPDKPPDKPCGIARCRAGQSERPPAAPDDDGTLGLWNLLTGPGLGLCEPTGAGPMAAERPSECSRA